MEGTGIIFGLVNGSLIEMAEGQYISEDVLQSYLEAHPNLLAGDQIDVASPRRWLLIGREIGVPDILDGKDRWSLDHLFVDQDSIPTLVEVKRSTDTRIRREVVGQMMDYAANASVYWTEGRIREAFATTCGSRGIKDSEVLHDFLGAGEAEGDAVIENFWSALKQNLESGRVRLLFVADSIPPELRRIIEFLNKQMTRTEVLGVEVRKFEGNGMTTFVPRVFGQTMEAIDTKERRSRGSAGDVIPTLIRNNVLQHGDLVTFDPPLYRNKIEEWLRQHPRANGASWQQDPNKTLLWGFDNQLYSCTGLAKRIYELAGNPVAHIRGPACFTFDGKTLVELAQTSLES